MAADTKRELAKAKIKYKQAHARLEKALKNELPEETACKAALAQLNSCWDSFEENCIEAMVDLPEEEHEEENERYLELEKKKEDLEEQAKNLLGKGDLEEVQYQVSSSSQNTINDPGLQIKQMLQKIPVSKKDKDEFEIKIADHRTWNWEEKASSKVCIGVDMDKYPSFLNNFMHSTGIMDPGVRKSFENMANMDEQSDMMNCFNSVGSNTSAIYGMYILRKRANGKKLDVAYSFFTCSASFKDVLDSQASCEVGGATWSLKSFYNWGNGRMHGDNHALINYIAIKALTSFEKNGTIDKINFQE